MEEVFERILDGQPSSLTQDQLLEFEGYCSARTFPLPKLIIAATAIFKNSSDLALHFLSHLERQELPKAAYNDFNHQEHKINIYNYLTGLLLSKAAKEENEKERERLLGEAKKYLSSGQKVRMTVDKSIFLNRALLHLYGGETTKALNLVTRIYQQIKQTGEGKHLLVTVMLVLAQIHFIRKNYGRSLQLYKKILATAKQLPPKGRLGMAYSFFYLGKYEMARACFQRLLQLQPNCVEALIGIATVYDREEDPRGYFQYLNKAYSVDKRHPLVLLHLAEHFLLRKELGKCEKLCQLGIESLEKRMSRVGKGAQEQGRNDYEEMKNRFNNMLGQTNHIRGNYPEAIKSYSLAVGKGLIHNDLYLAYCYTNPITQNYTEAIKLLEDCHRTANKHEARALNDSYRLLGYLKSKVPRVKEDRAPEEYYSEALKFNRLDFESKIEYANLLVENNKLKALRLLEEAEKIQMTLGNEPRPELLNNISVLHLENQESDLCLKKLNRCLQLLKSSKTANQEQQIRLKGVELIVRFNMGVCHQRRGCWESAKKTYEDMLQENGFYLDGALRLAYVWLQLGNYNRMNEVIRETEQNVEPFRRTVRPERFITARAYLQYIAGSSSEAKQSIKQLGKGKDVYSTLLELCINYEGIMRKGVEMNALKEFLRPSRQFCYKFCKEDPAATFGYMLLCIICLVDKKFTKTQGLEFFNSLKQFSVQDIPSILYNMGLFLLNYDDHEHSILVLTLFRDRTNNFIASDELIALNYLLDSQIQQAEELIKRNILRDPTNLKFKLQYAYLLERKSHLYYERGNFKKKEVGIRLKELRFCSSTYSFLARASISDIVRSIQCPELRERMKNLYIKAKSAGEERKFYIKSYMESFEKVLKDLTEQQNILLREERQQAALKAKEESQKGLMQLLEEEEQSEDQQTREKRQLERKRQRALQIAKKRQQQIDSAWGNLKAMDQEILQEKKSRKRGPRQSTPGNAPVKEKKRRPKESEPEEEPSLDNLPEDENSFQEEQSVNEEENEYDSQPHKKHKKDKKHKKHKKHKKEKRERERIENGSEGEREPASEEQESKQHEKKDEGEDDNEQLMKYML